MKRKRSRHSTSPFQPDNRVSQRHQIGLLFVNPDFDDNVALILNPYFILDCNDPHLDGNTLRDLLIVSKRWPHKRIVLLEWEPHPKLHPQTFAWVHSRGITRMDLPEVDVF